MAKGASKTADLKKVTVFRTVNGGVRQTLEYNLSDIQRGRQNDPEVEANDVVVVKESASKNALQDAVAIAPALYILTLFHF
jgi:hypothetical protein